MTTGDADVSRPGLRERKKQRTRDTIARVALELFAERGYDETTLEDIAEAADVSKRTIFSYYQSKEDILFHDEPRILLAIEQQLRSRPPGTTTVDALGDLLVALVPDKGASIRKRIIGESEALRLSERARFGRLEKVLAESLAQDLEAGPDDIRPILIAASVAAAFNVVYDRLLTQAAQTEICHEGAITAFDQLLELLRSGVDALQHRK
jgi:AcrR family transcriptional regulator